MTIEKIEEVQEGNIQISKKLYEELLEDQKMLQALEGAGVDNWEGYSEAMKLLEEMKNAG